MKGGKIPAGRAGFFLLPATVYVTPRRPCKRLPPCGVSLLLSCCKLVSVFPNADSDRLRVILVAPRNPLNIGAATRAMSNFGFFHLRVVNPYELAFREARSAIGAEPLLAQATEFKTVAEAVADCTLVVGTTSVRQRQLQHSARRLDQAASLLSKQLAGGRVALLFGSEKRGLSNEDLSHCHWLLRIPTREEHRSMNLGQAVAVCLYELACVSQASVNTEKYALAIGQDHSRHTDT